MIARGDLVGAAVIASASLGVLAAAELWARLGAPKPEWTRKFVHIGGGAICLSFPWLVRSPWVVLFLAVGLTALFALGSKGGFLKSLHRVTRTTRGSEYFPVAIFVTFLLSRGKPWLFVCSVLVLVVSDAMAALIGARFGRIRYEVDEDQKSLEGSLAFLVTAFVAIALPLVFMADLPVGNALLAALLVSAIATQFEAISLNGADNFFLPFAVCMILGKMHSKPLGELARQNLALLVIGVTVAVLARATRFFNVGATLALTLFAYAAWSLGSPEWMIPIALGLGWYVACRVIAPLQPGESGGIKVRTLCRALILPFSALALANAWSPQTGFFGPFLAAGTAILSFALWNHFLHLRPSRRWPRPLRAVGLSLATWTLVVLGSWALIPGVPILAALMIAAVVVPLAVVDDIIVGSHPEFDPRNRKWPASSFVLTLLAAAVIAALQRAGMIAPWPV